MKTTFAAAFALTLGLSSFAHAAGFNDQGPVFDTVSSTRAMRQDLSHLPQTLGFNQQSAPVIDFATSEPRNNTVRALAGKNCDLKPQTGFQDSSSFATC